MSCGLPHRLENVQHLSALEASVRLLPSLGVGIICNIFTGSLLHLALPFHMILVSSVLAAGAPLLMALLDTRWPYWYAAFPAQLLEPVRACVRVCVCACVLACLL